MSVTAIHDLGATMAPAAGSAPEREDDDLVAVTILQLISAEERLAHQAHLGDLHPTDSRRLAAVTAELDRCWSAGYLTRLDGEKELSAEGPSGSPIPRASDDGNHGCAARTRGRVHPHRLPEQRRMNHLAD